MASMASFALPTPLLLLIHLHLLDYPYANNAEYDQNVFNPHLRGIRERAKTLEDISYFLVGKIEGGRERAKSIFPVYPCLQPSHTTAFRASLAKYLEAIRHAATHSNAMSENKKLPVRSVKGKGKDASVESPVAWWWRDVVVRKSLLEECSGDRFERLVLALSTHALLKTLDGLPSNSISSAEEAVPTPLGIQAQEYAHLLSSSQSARRDWEGRATQLLRRQDDLKMLRERLATPSESSRTQYDNLTTDRLLALCNSRQQDLLRNYWKGAGGQMALDVLIDIAGVKPSSSLDDSLLSGPVTGLRDEKWENGKDTDNKISNLPSQSLPIAAAHYPTNVRKLTASVFPKSNKSAGRSIEDPRHLIPPRSRIELSMAGRLGAEKQTQRALSDALARARQIGDELRRGLQDLQERAGTYTPTLKSKLDLSERPQLSSKAINFNTSPNADLLGLLSLPASAPESALEERVDYIRESLLPAFPPIHSDDASPPHPPIERPTTRLPQPIQKVPSGSSWTHATRQRGDDLFQSQTQAGNPPQTPLRSYLTSTPPQSVKRSAYAQKVIKNPEKRSNKISMGKPALVRRRSRRASRLSVALTKRKTSQFSRKKDLLDAEVDRIVNAVTDHSASFEDIYNPIYATPKQKATISLMSRSTVKKRSRPRLTSAPRADDLDISLPEIPASASENEWTDEEDRVALSPGRSDDDDDEPYEGKSMTLADILLRAGDTTQFDLLDGDRFNLADESMGWD